MLFEPVPELPVPPDSNDNATFDARADSFFSALPAAVGGVNTFIESVEAHIRATYGGGGCGITATSATSASIGSGTFVLHIDSGKPIVPGQHVCVWSPTGQAGALCRVVSHVQDGGGDFGVLTLTVLETVGSGTHTDWSIFVVSPIASDAGFTTLPMTAQGVRRQLRDTAGKFTGLIPPAYNLFARDFALPSLTIFSRASSAWQLNAAAALVEAAPNVPRFDYDVEGSLLGLRIEGAATRLNAFAAAPTAAESVAVTAQAYTISFYGTGQVVLSGAHAATVTGAGAFPARVTHTFTPTAGTLTLTPSGTVQHLQVEAGTVATSPILGEGSQVARAADVATVALSDIEWNAAEGTLFVAGRTPGGAPEGTATQTVLQIDDGTNNNRLLVDRDSSRQMRCVAISSLVAQATLFLGTLADATDFRLVFLWRANEFLATLNAGADVKDTAGAVPSGLTTVRIGASLSGARPWQGTIKHGAVFLRALSAAQCRGMTP